MSLDVPTPDEWEDEREWESARQAITAGRDPRKAPQPPKVSDGFSGFASRIASHRERRVAIGQQALSFGVDFLDHAVGGIFPRDLVLLGASSGTGKTQLASLVAMYNVYRRRRVHMIALEAEDNEIEYRLLYRVVVNRMYQAGAGSDRLNYLDWYAGRLDDICAEYEREVTPMLVEQFSTLRTFYRARDFTGEQMVKLMTEIAADTDLIILDHLHYVDTTDPNENAGFKRIVKQLRDTALDIGKPVIVVAHVRKAERAKTQRTLVPALEDFHGSSDIPKIATKALMVAPAPLPEDRRSSHLFPTYMRAVKCRPDGGRTRYVGLVQFDARHAGYQRDFRLGLPVPGKDGEQFQTLGVSDWPAWAHHKPAFHYPAPEGGG